MTHRQSGSGVDAGVGVGNGENTGAGVGNGETGAGAASHGVAGGMVMDMRGISTIHKVAPGSGGAASNASGSATSKNVIAAIRILRIAVPHPRCLAALIRADSVIDAAAHLLVTTAKRTPRG